MTEAKAYLSGRVFGVQKRQRENEYSELTVASVTNLRLKCERIIEKIKCAKESRINERSMSWMKLMKEYTHTHIFKPGIKNVAVCRSPDPSSSRLAPFASGWWEISFAFR